MSACRPKLSWLFFLVAALFSAATTNAVTNQSGLTLLAGTPGYGGYWDATGSSAQFFVPHGMVSDSSGNIYLADTFNNLIRKVTPSGVSTTIAGATVGGYVDGTGSAARFSHPFGIAISSSGNLFVTDTQNNTIRKITPAGIVTTIAGSAFASGSTNGIGSAALFNGPTGIAVDASENLYVTDSGNNTIRKITAAGVVSTLAGTAGVNGSANGTGPAASFWSPMDIVVNSTGTLYVSDQGNNTIRKITAAGVVTTLAGTPGGSGYGYADGTGAAAKFYQPWGLSLDSAGNIYVLDYQNNLVRKVTPSGVVTTVVGTPGSTNTQVQFGSPNALYNCFDITVLPNGQLGLSCDSAIEKTTSNLTLIAGTPGYGGYWDATGSSAQFFVPHGMVSDSSGNIYLADTFNNLIRKVTPSGVSTTIAGATVGGYVDGTGSAARFSHPFGIAISSSGNLFVTDTQNNTIRKITPAGVVTTIAGSAFASGSTNGIGSAALFNGPTGIAVDASENLYVTDSGNNTIRKITAAGVVSTLAGTAGVNGSANGTGPAASFWSPMDIVVNSAGTLYVSDQGNNTIRKITAAGVVTTLAGTPGGSGYGYADGTGAAAKFYQPWGLSLDSAGNIYVLDYQNNLVRKVTPSGVVTTVVGTPGSTNTQVQFGSPNALYNCFDITVLPNGQLGLSCDCGIEKAAGL